MREKARTESLSRDLQYTLNAMVESVHYGNLNIVSTQLTPEMCEW